jgi:hypothetical protein
MVATAAWAEVPLTVRPFVLYAQFTVDTQVTLDDGSSWQMDKGDCFPVDMFKEHQTKIVLKLGGSTFIADAGRMRIMKESEEDIALKSYRSTLENYVKAKGDQWKKDAAAKGPATSPARPPLNAPEKP